MLKSLVIAILKMVKILENKYFETKWLWKHKSGCSVQLEGKFRILHKKTQLTLKATMIITYGMISIWLTDKTGTKRCQLYINVTPSKTRVTQKPTTWRKKAMLIFAFTLLEDVVLRVKIVGITTEYQYTTIVLVRGTILKTYLEGLDMVLTKMIWQALALLIRNAELYFCKEFKCQWTILSLKKLWLP